MRGKLAKAIRRSTGFHPHLDRQYRLTNVVRKVGLRHGMPVGIETGSFVAVGCRNDYQELKQRVLARKRRGYARA